MTPLAHNYDPLDITITSAQGCYVTDTSGKRYLDCLAGYSALNFGHRHPELIAAAKTQLDRLTLTSRAVRNDLLEPFAEAITELTDTEMFIPMNTGAEAVKTALKAARKWGYEVKGVEADSAEIIVADRNFHGRTITVVSMSGDPDVRNGFGPYTPGFVLVDYNDAQAIARAITPNTVAVLVEPIQGEAGVIIPSDDYLPQVRQICTDHNVLLILDEIQSGLGRTGTTLAAHRVGVRADLTALGKALGGGIVASSGVVGSREVLGVFSPGSHGSTFGGNPMACAVGLAVVKLLASGHYQARARELHPLMDFRARELVADGRASASRCVGLWLGLDVVGKTGREVALAMAERGVIAKETHGNTIRLAPPLGITEGELAHVMEVLGEAIS